MAEKLKKIFEPIKVGKMELKNRIVYPPMVCCFGDPLGGVTPHVIENYVQAARSGVGLITVEAHFVREDGKVLAGALGADRARFIPGLADIVDAVHAYCPDPPKIILQIHHSGRETEPEFTGHTTVAPSAVPSILHPLMKQTSFTRKHNEGLPMELSIEDIMDLEDAYADAAQRAAMAGFDGVELHGAHGYLIAQFLSPFSNKRTDMYGIDRRLFLRNIIKKIQARLGPDFPIVVRLSGSEFVPGAAHLPDRLEVAKELEELGVCGISVTGGIYESGFYIIPTSGLPTGTHIENASKIKEVVSIPVWGVGRIIDLRLAERYLEEGKVDLVAIGRPLLADRDMIKKSIEGRFDDVRQCLGCNYCIARIFTQRKLNCTVNPAIGDPVFGEIKYEEMGKEKAAVKKKVVIVGGGPAGMEAARIAAQRGHDVTLIEKEKELGGNLVCVSLVSYKNNFYNFIKYLERQIKNLNVNIELGKEATSSYILSKNPDVVILATGASVTIPKDIPGSSKSHVFDAISVAKGKVDVGEKVLIIGGGMVAVDTAVILAEKGKKVTLVTEGTSEFGPGVGLATEWDGLTRLWVFFVKWPTLNIEVHQFSKVVEIGDKTVKIMDKDGNTKDIETESVVFAKDMSPNVSLKADLLEKVPEVYTVGDAKRPRVIANAVKEGSTIARLI